MVLLGKACSLNLAILEMACFPSSGAALAQLAAIVNPANKPTQIEMHLQAQIGRWAKNWLSYSVFEKKCLSAITVFFAKKRALPILFCHKSEPSKQYMSFRIIWKKFATIATLGTNQDSTLQGFDTAIWLLFGCTNMFKEIRFRCQSHCQVSIWVCEKEVRGMQFAQDIRPGYAWVPSLPCATHRSARFCRKLTWPIPMRVIHWSRILGSKVRRVGTCRFTRRLRLELVCKLVRLQTKSQYRKNNLQ